MARPADRPDDLPRAGALGGLGPERRPAALDVRRRGGVGRRRPGAAPADGAVRGVRRRRRGPDRRAGHLRRRRRRPGPVRRGPAPPDRRAAPRPRRLGARPAGGRRRPRPADPRRLPRDAGDGGRRRRLAGPAPAGRPRREHPRPGRRRLRRGRGDGSRPAAGSPRRSARRHRTCTCAATTTRGCASTRLPGRGLGRRRRAGGDRGHRRPLPRGRPVAPRGGRRRRPLPRAGGGRAGRGMPAALVVSVPGEGGGTSTRTAGAAAAPHRPAVGIFTTGPDLEGADERSASSPACSRADPDVPRPPTPSRPLGSTWPSPLRATRRSRRAGAGVPPRRPLHPARRPTGTTSPRLVEAAGALPRRQRGHDRAGRPGRALQPAGGRAGRRGRGPARRRRRLRARSHAAGYGAAGLGSDLARAPRGSPRRALPGDGAALRRGGMRRRGRDDDVVDRRPAGQPRRRPGRPGGTRVGLARVGPVLLAISSCSPLARRAHGGWHRCGRALAGHRPRPQRSGSAGDPAVRGRRTRSRAGDARARRRGGGAGHRRIPFASGCAAAAAGPSPGRPRPPTSTTT